MTEYYSWKSISISLVHRDEHKLVRCGGEIKTVQQKLRPKMVTIG